MNGQVRDLSGVTVAGRYTIEREIGRGGMATVWMATDTQHQRAVAIKTLHPDLAGAVGTDRFLREIRLTAQLQHPGIVPILDSGAIPMPDGTRLPWYAMPLLQGESLRARLARDLQLSIDEALRITEAVGRALEAAHRRDIVHRDIKPENIFLSGDQVYVVDFGIARAVAATDAERLTSTGLAVGTPTYMSPEQAMAGVVDARSDQYSLASILYEMLAGEPPFAGPNQQAIIARRLAEPARPLSTVRSTVPGAVERATLRALERAPADRFASVGEFLTALRAADTSASGVRQRGHRRVLVASLLAVGAAIAAWVAFAPGLGARARRVDPEVVALYERGVRAYDRRTPDAVAEAVTTMRAAIQRDSFYAPAWNALAKTYARAYERGFRNVDSLPERLLQLGVAAVDRALELDAESADTWMTHAILSHLVDPTDLGPPLRSIRKSIGLDSLAAPPWHFFARFLAESGDLAGGLEAWRHCVRLGPGYAQGVAFLALAHYWRANFDSAAFWADSALKLDPTYVLARSTAGLIAIEQGDIPRAESSIAAFERLSTDVEYVNARAILALFYARAGQQGLSRAVLLGAEVVGGNFAPLPAHSVLYIAQAMTALGDTAAALRVLNGYQPVRDTHFQLHLRCDPPFEPLWSNPRYRALLIIPRPASGKGC